MHDSDLLLLIGSLSKRQLGELEKFLKSPYHNTNNTIKELFRYIRRYYPNMQNPKLSKQHAFFQLFPDENFDDGKIRTQMHRLKAVVEDFVIQEQLKLDKSIQQRLLIQHYYGVEDYKRFSSRIKKRIEQLKKAPIRDTKYHLELIWLYETLFYHPRNDNHHRFKSHDPLLHLPRHLDMFFLLNKSRLETDFNIRKNLVKEDIPFYIPFPTIQEHLTAHTAENSLIRLYAQLIEFQLQNPELTPGDFSKCIQNFEDLLQQMEEVESSFLLNVLINIAIAYQNNGHEPYISLAAKLFRLADEQDMILYQGQLQVPIFLNACSVGSGAHEFTWVDQFIKRYQVYLVESEREKAVKLSRGSWYYHQSKVAGIGAQEKKALLEKALQSISAIPYSGISYDLQIRCLQFRIHYDLHLPAGDDPLLIDNARAFESYLKSRKELAVERKEAYLQFIRYTRELAKFYRHKQLKKMDPNTLPELRERIANDPNVKFKIWLLHAVRELQ